MTSQIQSVARSFDIIEFLSLSPKAQPLKEISAACSLPVTTTHRLLNNLCSLGYVIHESNGLYKLSYRLFEISSRSLFKTNIVSTTIPYLDEIGEELGESVHLVTRDGNDIVYVYKTSSSMGSVQMASRIGMRLPMYRCAVGKAIMSTLPDMEIQEIFASTDVVACTKNTVVTFDALMEQIYQIREREYALDDEENEEGIKCVAVTLGRKGDAAKYAFSVSSLKSRMDDSRTAQIAKILLSTKQTIEEVLVDI